MEMTDELRDVIAELANVLGGGKTTIPEIVRCWVNGKEVTGPKYFGGKSEKACDDEMCAVCGAKKTCKKAIAEGEKKPEADKYVVVEPSSKATGKARKLDTNNDILDDIQTVVYDEPETIVVFKDGSRVRVKAGGDDKFTKELAVVYAIVKRLYATDIDKDGYMFSNGIDRKIRKIVRSGVDRKAIKTARAERKAKIAAEKAATPCTGPTQKQ